VEHSPDIPLEPVLDEPQEPLDRSLQDVSEQLTPDPFLHAQEQPIPEPPVHAPERPVEGDELDDGAHDEPDSIAGPLHEKPELALDHLEPPIESADSPLEPAYLESAPQETDHAELPPVELPPVAATEPVVPAPAPRRTAPSTLSAPPPLPPLPAGPRAGGRSSRDAGSPAGRSVARIGALAALAAVVVIAVILLIHSLASSKKEKPPATPVVVKVLIPEGKTRAQIAEIAKAAGLKGSYRTAAKSSSLLNPTHYGAPKDTPDLEGFLFPATYELDRGTQVGQLVHEQLIAFQENFSSEYFHRAKELHVSAYELLIVASMIEREAQVSGDRAKIAAVIYNRLADGMPLGIDASIYYAVEEQQHIATYTHELTESQLHIDSPYNTRTHTGLPPTPISNPGVASIKAAAHPAHVAYLYYVAGADGCGEQVFSDTLSEFEANAAAYEAAVKRNGGHPPACKHH
jgi:uncharacterized YceG family protein